MAGLLEQFTGDDRRIVLAMLDCIWGAGSEAHINEVRFRRDMQGTHFTVQPREGHQRNHDPLIAGPTLIPRLDHAGLIHIVPANAPRFNKAKGAMVFPEPSIFAFSNDAFKAYKDFGKLSDADVRLRIGQHLYGLYNADPHGFHEYNVDAVAAEIDVDPTWVRQQTQLLLDVGVLNADATPANNPLKFGFLSLSKPAGLLWASRGFPDDLSGAQTIRVEFDLAPIIRAIERLPLSDDTKVEVEDLVEDFHREPSPDKAARLLGILADLSELSAPVAGLVGMLGRFIAGAAREPAGYWPERTRGLRRGDTKRCRKPCNAPRGT